MEQEPVGGWDSWAEPVVTSRWHETLAAFVRGGGRCGICGEAVNLLVTSGKWQACVDHIKPLSKGGADARVNIQVAHRGCNSRKGNR